MNKIFFESLGCDKNLVDSEEMLGLLAREGFCFTDREQEAEVIIVNTCAFIGDAKEESIETILRLAQYKESGSCRVLLAAGCLAERYQEEILTELPELDGIVGIGSWDRIVTAVKDALAAAEAGSGEKIRITEDSSRLPMIGGVRQITTGGHYAYLKIAEGCDKYCTYCAIPYIRGHYRSYPMETLIGEARRLAKSGVRELILVAQETTLYGTDLYGRKALPELVRALAQIPELRWIRLLYGYPEELTDEMILMMKQEKKLLHYLDLPIQHASDAVLARMGRRTTGADIRALVAKLRREIPDITLRTTLMSGFPGETEEDHQENLALLRELRFDRMGAFAYSREEGTAAYGFGDRVPKRTAVRRRNELMRLQQSIAFEKNRALPGREMEVMVEGYIPEEGVYAARTPMDAPEVDGLLFFPADREFMSGDFVRIRVTGARDYDLLGEVIDEPAE